MKNLIILISILITNFAFGQIDSLSFEEKVSLSSRDCAHSHICCQVKCPCCPNYGKIDFGPNIPLDSLQIKFAHKIYSLEKTYLPKKVKPTDTINIDSKKYSLKFVEKIGLAPTYEEFQQFASNITYSCIKYGNDHVIIKLSRNTGIPNETNYFYEILREDKSNH